MSNFYFVLICIPQFKENIFLYLINTHFQLLLIQHLTTVVNQVLIVLKM